MSDPAAGDDPGGKPATRRPRRKSGRKAEGKKAELKRGTGKRGGKPAKASGAAAEPATESRGGAARVAVAPDRASPASSASEATSAPRTTSDAEPANDHAGDPPAAPGTTESAGAAKKRAGKPAARKKSARGAGKGPRKGTGKARVRRAADPPTPSPAASAGALLAGAASFTAGLLRAVVAPALAPFAASHREEGSGAEAATRAQVGVLPMRRGGDGRLRVLLVTSRETRRWVIPKGWPMRGRAPHEAAAREAFEEAGLVGRVGDRAVGRYAYRKRMKGGPVTCIVEVFPFRVRKRLKTWPEKRQRTARWFAPEEAAGLVAEPDLAALIREVGARAGEKDAKAGRGAGPPP